MPTYSESRKRLHYATYPLSVYESLVERALSSTQLTVKPFVQKRDGSEALPVLSFRHDIDTQACVEGMSSVLDIDIRHSVKSGTYLRADEEDYRLRDVEPQVTHYRNLGLEMGLHTVCYREDDYFSELKREIAHFEDTLGFSPSSFTVHGLGQHRIDIRREFYKKVVDIMPSLKLSFTDCNPAYRRYHYVIEDCHFDSQKGRRFIYEDFEAFPPFFKDGHEYLVLTHPCYWA